MTQPELAEELGLSPETVSRIERGETLPSIATLESFAALLRCAPSDLLDDAGRVPAAIDHVAATWLARLNSKADRDFVIAQLVAICRHLIK